MKTLRSPTYNEMRVDCAVYGCRWTPKRFRQAYEAIVEAWTEAGYPPDQLSAKAPGVGSRWGSYKYKRKRFERAPIDQVQYAHLVCLAEPNDDYPNYDFMTPELHWLVSARLNNYDQSTLSLGWVPTIIGAPAEAFLDLFRPLCEISRGVCGARRARRNLPAPYDASNPYRLLLESLQSIDSRWIRDASQRQQVNTLLLSGLHPHNYLSETHLEAPFGKTGTTLRKWIEADPPRRGTVRPYTNMLFEWTPPEERVPELREALFRAGRLDCAAFFKEIDYDHVVLNGELVPCSEIHKMPEAPKGPLIYPPERLYRPDLDAPWEAPEPIPERYQAEVYRRLLREERRRIKEADAAPGARRRSDAPAASPKRKGPSRPVVVGRGPGTPGIDLDKRNTLIIRHAMEHIRRRREKNDHAVEFDLRKLNRIAGRDMCGLVNAAFMHCDRSRFWSMSQEEIARELLRLERTGFPKAESKGTTAILQMSSTRLIWMRESTRLSRPPSVLLTLEDFFDGNDDPESIQPLRGQGPGPDLHTVREGLFAIRDRDEVEDIRMIVSYWPDPEAPKEDAMWMRTNVAHVYTWGARLVEMRRWASPLGDRKVRHEHVRLHITNAPPTRAGMRLYSVSW